MAFLVDQDDFAGWPHICGGGGVVCEKKRREVRRSDELLKVWREFRMWCYLLPGREIFLCKGFTQATPTNTFTSIVDWQDPAHYIDSYAAHAHRRIRLHNGGRRSLAVASFYWVSNHRDEIKCPLVLLCTQYYSKYREFPHQRHRIKCAPSWEENTKYECLFISWNNINTTCNMTGANANRYQVPTTYTATSPTHARTHLTHCSSVCIVIKINV